MNIEVNVFNREHRFLAQPHVTIERIYERVAIGLGLTLANRKLFGLQAYNEWHQAVVWPKPSDSLAVAIDKGLRYKPLAVSFFLRAHSFPDDFEKVRNDPVAVRLFFAQVAERFNQRGYNAESAIEVTLACLALQAEYGSLHDVTARFSIVELTELALGRIIIAADKQQQADLPKRLTSSVLQLWQLFGEMSSDEAAYNYLSILAGAGYHYETVRFTVYNFSYSKPADVEISYTGIDIRQPGDGGDNTEHIAVPWADVRSIEQKHHWFVLRLFDASERPSLIEFRANSPFVATRMQSLVKKYHRVYSERQIGKRVAPSVRLVLSNPNQFLGDILHNMVALGAIMEQHSRPAAIPVPSATQEPEENYEVAQEEQLEDEVETAEYQTETQPELDEIIANLAGWIEANRNKFEDNEAVLGDINQLFALSSSIYDQINQQFKVYEDSDEAALVEEENIKKQDDGEIEETEQHSSSPVAQVNLIQQPDSDVAIDEQSLVEQKQSEEVCQEQDAPVEEMTVTAEPFDGQCPAEDAVDMLQNSSESGDELISDRLSVDFSHKKDPKFLIRRSLVQQTKSCPAQLVVMSQVGQCFDQTIDTEIEQTEMVESESVYTEYKTDDVAVTDDEIDDQSTDEEEQEEEEEVKQGEEQELATTKPRNRFAALRLSLFEH